MIDIETSTIDTSKWPEEARTQYAALTAQLEEERHLLEEAEAQEEARKASPQVALEALGAELEEARKARRLAEAEREADAVYAKAVKEHGDDRVGRLRTIEGSIIQRAMTIHEIDGGLARSEALEKTADQINLSRAQIREATLYPPRDRFNELLGRYPGTWVQLYEMRDTLNSAVREAHQKKG